MIPRPVTAAVALTAFDAFALAMIAAMMGAIAWWLWTIYRDAHEEYQQRRRLEDQVEEAQAGRDQLGDVIAMRVTRRRPCGCDPDLFEGCFQCIRPNVTTPPTPGA